ncbi:MAG TPA: hypothetical protein VKP68_19600 [Ramlibacter sp.]|nr:hypothetical protein [Ramlibacter sp.]
MDQYAQFHPDPIALWVSPGMRSKRSMQVQALSGCPMPMLWLSLVMSVTASCHARCKAGPEM